MRFSAACCLMLMAGCASIPSPSTSRACVDADRAVLRFHVENPRTVVVEQSSRRRYRVHLAEDCPRLLHADHVAFSTGIPRIVGYREGVEPVWAETRYGAAHFCARQGDDLLVPEWSSRTDQPAPRCKIAFVERL